MNEAEIIGAGRNPRIAGTRITVFTILEYIQDGWRRMTLHSGSSHESSG